MPSLSEVIAIDFDSMTRSYCGGWNVFNKCWHQLEPVQHKAAEHLGFAVSWPQTVQRFPYTP